MENRNQQKQQQQDKAGQTSQSRQVKEDDKKTGAQQADRTQQRAPGTQGRQEENSPKR